MRPPKSLPEELTGRTFTRREATRLGVTSDRLRARDIHKVAHATYRHTEPAVGGRSRATVPQPSSLISPDAEQIEVLRAICRRSAQVRISHVSAALLHGLPVPARLAENSALHLTGTNRSHTSFDDPGVKLHRAADAPDCSYLVCGVPVSPPAELFVELARYMTVFELVVLGDQLVRNPRTGLESRDAAWCSVNDLERQLRTGRGKLGATRAREALGLVRVGADSPPETRMRLALVSAGLPEPELQIPIDRHDPYSPVADAGYRSHRLALQYEGEHHFTPEQQARDQRRNAQFEAAGWTVILANRVDLRENFRTLVRRVGARLMRPSRA